MGADNLMVILSVVLGIGFIILFVWAAMDAFSNTDMGCLWLFLFIFAWPLTLPAYLFMRFYVNRPVDKNVLLQRQLEREDAPVTRFPSDIQRAKYIDMADKRQGTMYEPGVPVLEAADGYKHFSDARAELMLKQRRHEEAYDYLIDLYSLAMDSSDARGRDTYRWYLAQVPGGRELLRQWETEHRLRRPDAGPAAKRSDDMPF